MMLKSLMCRCCPHASNREFDSQSGRESMTGVPTMTKVLITMFLLTTVSATASSQTRRQTTPVDKKTTSASQAAIEAAKNKDVAPLSNEIRCRGYAKVGGSQFVFLTLS